MAESGDLSEEAAWDMVDRVAAIPAQLTSYDSGALEIFALRRHTEEALGADFDIRKFHARVLGAGMIPMWLLRDLVEAWVASQYPPAQGNRTRGPWHQ